MAHVAGWCCGDPLHLRNARIAFGACVQGVPRWCDRFGQCGIKVCFWGSGTLKIVIYVENYSQEGSFLLADYHPLWGAGVLISGHHI